MPPSARAADDPPMRPVLVVLDAPDDNFDHYLPGHVATRLGVS
ncbi:hypothetical protein [Rhodococcus rhodochrous]|nr:hypothetical protein [Rhodococcus rhodochrous]